MYTHHTIENLKDRLEKLCAEFQDPNMTEGHLADIAHEIFDAMTEFGNYSDIKDFVPPELNITAFKIFAKSILNLYKENSDQEDALCWYANSILRVVPPEVELTDEYRELVACADKLTSVPENILTKGNIKYAGNHIRDLPLLLQSFAIATGKRVEGENFVAAVMSLDNMSQSCVVMKPANQQPVLAIEGECTPFNPLLPGLMGALTLGKAA